MERGRLRCDDLSAHVRCFKQVAIFSGKKAESNDANQLFIKSMNIIPMEGIKDDKRKFKSSDEMVKISMDSMTVRTS